MGYAHPEVLVETAWVAEHLNDPGLRIVEVSVDTNAYSEGHVPGAIGLGWNSDIQQSVRRDFVDRAGFEALLGRVGIGNEHAVILYGDSNNWFATWAYWLFKYYGHDKVRIMNGGRLKWLAEQRPLSTGAPSYPPTRYAATAPNTAIRAFRQQVLDALGKPSTGLVDVRSPKEFAGELLAPENLPQEGAQRGGHIPGAANIPWATAVREDGTFKSADDLKALFGDKGITPDKEIVTYCRIGERSSLSWFVLTQLLGYPKVKNYDGSWTEWGSLVDVPIER
jgi:thiosulfate/3-mercaptopyruvate sulfurtransferase